jgi:hypothetical protein
VPPSSTRCFLSYIKAGFSRKEALYLSGKYLSAVVIGMNTPSDDAD